MDSIEFRVLPGSSDPHRTLATIDILVNGVRLLGLVRQAELPFATQEVRERAADFGPEELAGAYTNLLAEYGWPSRHLLGEPEDEPAGIREDGETMLLICPCGFAECWAMLARIEVAETIVRWSGFRNSHRDWELSAVGPFTFSRTQYEVALRHTGVTDAAPTP